MLFVIVTGGVISGLGKGITASSIGLLLKSTGLTVTAIKIDPYLNVDAGTMSPFEHGECYVLKDGGEVDLDLGNYERFLNIELTKEHNITTGKIYLSVINKERRGDYLGKTVQVIPHLTNEIIDHIERVAQQSVSDKKPNVCIIEMGGTIGDIENKPFIEAIRQMSIKKEHKFCFVHVSLLVENGGELKTKPTQHSLSTLRSLGIVPDILVLRTPTTLSKNLIKKISLMGQIKEKNIICNINVPNIYYVPDSFEKQNITKKVLKILNLSTDVTINLNEYYKILNHFKNNYEKIIVGIAGKYVGSPDTYLTLIRAIYHASFYCRVNFDIKWIDTELLEKHNANLSILNECNVIIIPGGFGSRGIEGKIKVANFCRLNNKPLLGLCLGMQIMVTELARSVGLINANSIEWDSQTNHPVVAILPNQTGIKGGTMRLGNWKTILKPNTLVHKLYKTDNIMERHRHRYEINNKYVPLLEKNNLVIAGTGINDLVEIIELANDHPFYIGCQFHPEYRSRYSNPHPLFVGLLNTCGK